MKIKFKLSIYLLLIIPTIHIMLNKNVWLNRLRLDNN